MDHIVYGPPPVPRLLNVVTQLKKLKSMPIGVGIHKHLKDSTTNLLQAYPWDLELPIQFFQRQILPHWKPERRQLRLL
jgi:hypothetical protein